MGRSPGVYGSYFLLNAAGYMIGNFLSGRFSLRFGSEKLIDDGLTASVFAVLVTVAFPLLTVWTPPMPFVPPLLNGIANGLTVPGAASGLLGFLQLGMGALGA